MATSLRVIFFQFALVSAFIIASLSFVGQFQIENNADSTIFDNDIINRTLVGFSVPSNLTINSSQLDEQKGVYESEIPERGFGSLLIFSIVTVGQQFANTVVSTYNLMIVLPASVLGIPPVIIGIFTSILIVSLVLLTWRVVRLGS